MEWFHRISQPFMTAPREPSRHSPMVHDDTFIIQDPSQQGIDAAAMPKPPSHVAADVDI